MADHTPFLAVAVFSSLAGLTTGSGASEGGLVLLFAGAVLVVISPTVHKNLDFFQVATDE